MVDSLAETDHIARWSHNAILFAVSGSCYRHGSSKNRETYQTAPHLSFADKPDSAPNQAPAAMALRTADCVSPCADPQRGAAHKTQNNNNILHNNT